MWCSTNREGNLECGYSRGRPQNTPPSKSADLQIMQIQKREWKSVHSQGEWQLDFTSRWRWFYHQFTLPSSRCKFHWVCQPLQIDLQTDHFCSAQRIILFPNTILIQFYLNYSFLTFFPNSNSIKVMLLNTANSFFYLFINLINFLFIHMLIYSYICIFFVFQFQ